jgi:hypothetical protein
MRKPIKTSGTLRIDAYKVLMTAVEDGIRYGLRRADKHANDPLTETQRERMQTQLEIEIGNAICEILKFDE